jgi:hypothetical protein
MSPADVDSSALVSGLFLIAHRALPTAYILRFPISRIPYYAMARNDSTGAIRLLQEGKSLAEIR